MTNDYCSKNANTSIYVHYIKQLVRTMSLAQVELCVQIKVLLGDTKIKSEEYMSYQMVIIIMNINNKANYEPFYMNLEYLSIVFYFPYKD